jgi:hypothetical protein
MTAIGATVSGAINNGAGNVRLTINQNIGTGTLAVVSGVGGVPGANGQFTLTNIDTTHVDLAGSTFSGAYTSGGTVSTQSNAAQLSAGWTRVTAGNTGGGVRLPTGATGGTRNLIKNATGNDGMIIWPNVNVTINNLAANAPMSSPNNWTSEFWPSSATQWDTQP